MRPPTALALVAVASALAGCGGSSPAAPRSAGQTLFAQDCSACHSLTGRESPRRQGGDLRGVRLSPAVMLQFARQMPIRHRLSSAELKVVADYVVAVERRGR